MLVAAATAETSYYEAYGAPVVDGASPTKVTKIGVGVDLDLSQGDGKSYVTHDVTTVFQNLATGENPLDQIQHQVVACVDVVKYGSDDPCPNHKYYCYEFGL